MCQETSASIIPRIVGILTGETAPWTGNEILGRISTGDSPCEPHFDEALRQLIRENRVTSESEPDPHLSTTARCKLGYMLVAEVRAPSVVKPVELPTPPSTRFRPPPPPPPVPVPMTAALPSRTVRADLIGRIREEKAKVDREWTSRFGADWLWKGPPEFVKALFLQARARGLLPRFRDALERSRGKKLDDFEKKCDALLQITERDGTIPLPVIDAGIRLDPGYYAALDLDRAEKELRDGGEGNAANAREILAFLKDALDDASLARHWAEPAKPAPTAPVPAAAPSPAPPPSAASEDPLIGSSFGAYKIIGTIGKGGMGAVYEGVDETLDRRVALKVLHPGFADNREYQERFLREARNAANANLDHPNITQIYAAGRQGPHLWLAMQFIRGRTLSRLLQERKKLPAKEALRIVRQVAEGLSVAHKAWLIHRDIKPDNLMIDETGRMKIMDFGLMRSVDVKKDGLTQDGLFVGTLEYASPEQCQDKPLDARTDLYSLGVVLYELLSGARPYKARTALGYLSMIPDPQQPPVPLQQQDPEIPAELVSLVHRLISKRPDERPAVADVLIEEIDRILPVSVPLMTAARSPRPAPQPSSRPPMRSLVLTLVGCGLALAAGIGAAIWLWPKDEAPKVSRSVPVTPVVEKPRTPAAVSEPKPPATPVVKSPEDAKPLLTPAPPQPPVHPPPPKDPRLALLEEHVPDEKELQILEELLALSRSTLAERSGYSLGAALDRAISFRSEHSLTPWLALFADAEVDRFQAAFKAFQARPLIDPAQEVQLDLRDGRRLRGRVTGENGGRLAVELADGGKESLPPAALSPSTFAVTRGTGLDAVRIRSAAGDAAGAVAQLGGLDPVQQRLLLPLLLDQAIEEKLASGNPADIAGYEIAAAYRGAEALLPARMKRLATEKEAAALLRRIGDDGVLEQLLTVHASTRAGVRTAAQALSDFDHSIPAEEKFELVSAAAWGTWDVDSRDAAGGSVVLDKSSGFYALNAPSAKQQVRLVKKLKGAERGYRVRWKYGAGAPDPAAFMVALSFTRWFEIAPKGLSLFRVDKDGGEEKVTTARKVEFPERISGGVLHVIPKAALVLVYLNDRLLLALPAKEYALGGGLQLGMSGGSLTLESLRVLDRTRD